MSEPIKNVKDEREVLLGSGDLYAVVFTGAIPSDEEIETEENRAGLIKGGCTLSYGKTTQTVKDDMGYVTKTVPTEENVTLKAGMITWSDLLFKASIETARVLYETKNQKTHRITKIGGLKNQNNVNALYRFVHTKSDGTKLRATVTGKNTAEIAIAFTNDNPTQIDPEITASALDGDGTLVILDEELAAQEVS